MFYLWQRPQNAGFVVAAMPLLQRATTKLSEALEQAIEQVDSAIRCYTVYALMDGEEVKYVGRTMNYTNRMAAHGLNPYRADLIPVKR